MSQLTLQLPQSVLDAARKLAEREHLSLEEFVSRMIAESIERDDAWRQRVARGKHVTRERFLEILSKAGNEPPVAGDEIKS